MIFALVCVFSLADGKPKELYSLDLTPAMEARVQGHPGAGKNLCREVYGRIPIRILVERVDPRNQLETCLTNE